MLPHYQVLLITLFASSTFAAGTTTISSNCVTSNCTTSPTPVPGSGPYDMGYTYNSKMNLTTYIGGGPATGNEHTECAADPTGGYYTTTSQAPYFKVFTGTFNVFAIYYSSSKSGANGTFTTTQMSLIDNFIANIGGSSVWKVAKKYNGRSVTPGTPTLGKAIGASTAAGIFVDCTGKYAPANGCALANDQSTVNTETDLIYNLISGVSPSLLPKDSNGIYIIVMGSDVSYHYSDSSSGADWLLPQAGSNFCGRTDFMSNNYWSSTDNSAALWYAIIGMPGTLKNCKFIPGTTTINGDAAVDNVIPILFHELVETSVNSAQCDTSGNNCNSQWFDGCGLEPADKCQNMFANATLSGTAYYNIVLNTQKYMIQPIWDPINKICSMG